MKSQIMDLRVSIDEIDRQLGQLFSQRMALVAQLGELKQQMGMGVIDIEREAQVLVNWCQTVDGEYQDLFVQWMQELLLISKRYQSQLRGEHDEEVC
jgi:chorismate mutase / prephenate dehydratase